MLTQLFTLLLEDLFPPSSKAHKFQNISSIIGALISQSEGLSNKITLLSEKEKTTVQKLSEREAQADDKLAEVDKIKQQLVRIGVISSLCGVPQLHEYFALYIAILLADQVTPMSLILSILPILQTRHQANCNTPDWYFCRHSP